MPKMRDPYLAGWNAAIEAAAAAVKKEHDGHWEPGPAWQTLPQKSREHLEIEFAHEKHGLSLAVDIVRELKKPEPIPDDHWRRVNDGDWDYDPPRKGPTRD
jgi:hypothetical protein